MSQGKTYSGLSVVYSSPRSSRRGILCHPRDAVISCHLASNTLPSLHLIAGWWRARPGCISLLCEGALPLARCELHCLRPSEEDNKGGDVIDHVAPILHP